MGRRVRLFFILLAALLLSAWTHGAGYLTNNALSQLTTDSGQPLYPGK